MFCDQTQFSAATPPEEVEETVLDFLRGCRSPESRRRILAFYGGSFTGIKADERERYLAIAEDLIRRDIVHGIKASTRPDLIDGQILRRLVGAGFVEIELGAQSMDDTVLDRSLRGHTGAQTVAAAQAIKAAGLKLGIQLMPGLPGEGPPSFRHTVEAVLALAPDTARLYPVVVLAGTELEGRYRRGEYTPLDLDEAVDRCLFASTQLQAQGCTILRMGLPLVESLKIVAGPVHPAFGFLVQARAFSLMAEELLRRFGPETPLKVHPRDIAALVGHRGATQRRLTFDYAADPSVPRGCISASVHSNYACLSTRDVIQQLVL